MGAPSTCAPERPEFRHYTRLVRGRGDFGVVAERAGEQVGVAWAQFLPADEPGYGFFDEATAECSLWVRPDAREQGLGRSVLRQLKQETTSRHVPRLSLSVEPGNHATRLYASEGFLPVVGREADGVMCWASNLAGRVRVSGYDRFGAGAVVERGQLSGLVIGEAGAERSHPNMGAGCGQGDRNRVHRALDDHRDRTRLEQLVDGTEQLSTLVEQRGVGGVEVLRPGRAVAISGSGVDVGQIGVAPGGAVVRSRPSRSSWANGTSRTSTRR